MAQTTGIQPLDNTLTLLERDFGITMDPARVQRIADEIRRGERTAQQARLDIFEHVVGEQRVQEWVRQEFSSRGLNVATGGESEGARLSRITGELMSGQRTFHDLGQTLDRFAPEQPSPRGGTGGTGDAGGGTGGTDGGGTTGGSETTLAERNAVARINEVLQRYGLPASLGDWVWNSVVVEGLSESEVMLELRERPEFQERFPAIAQGALMSPAEYVEYEQNALSLFQQAGIPGALFDDPEEFQELIAEQISNNVALPELAQRLNQNFADVTNAPREVRDAFAEFFMGGEAGDMALAALMLDPDRALPRLERMVQTAQVAGAGARFDFNVSQQFAERAAELGITRSGATEGFGRASRLRPLTQSIAGERTTFGTQQLLEGTLLDDALAVDQMRRRQEGRVGAFQGGQQAVRESGVTGLGVSNE